MDSFEEKFSFSLHFSEGESDEDRLKKCIDQLFEKPIIIEDTRSTNNAVMFNAMATTAMSHGNYNAAINFYTKGLQEVAPFCEFSAILYSYRAAVFTSLSMYREGIDDINRAIEMSGNTELTRHFQAIKNSIERAVPYGKTIRMDSSSSDSHFRVPSLLDKENKNVPGMSVAVCLVHNAKYGVNLEAVKPISNGDLILIEKPQVTSILQSDVAVANVCYYCLKQCRALLPCEQCNNALYCSKECRAKAYGEYHRTQCSSKNFPDDIQFVINLFMKITKNGEKLTEAIKYCEELDTMSTDSMKEFCRKRDNLGSNLKSVLNLSISMKKNDKKNAKNILRSAYTASFLRNETNYLQGYRDILSIAKLLFRLFYIFDVHAFLDNISHYGESVIGVYNLYSLLSLVQHSCRANTEYSIHECGVIAVRAARDIKPGEQITFNFLRIKNANIRNDFIPRQFVLRERKHILCDCSNCDLPYIYVPFVNKLKTGEVLEHRLRKKRFNIDNSLELTATEVDRV